MWTAILGFFKGIKLRWRGILIICLFAALVLFSWQMISTVRKAESLRMENDRIAQSLQQQNKEMEKLLKEVKLNRKINERNREAVKKVRESLRGIPYEVADKIEQSKEFANWSDNRFPNAAMRQLRGWKKSSESDGNQTNSTSKGVGHKNRTSYYQRTNK